MKSYKKALKNSSILNKLNLSIMTYEREYLYFTINFLSF